MNKVLEGSILRNARIDNGFIITSVITSDGNEIEVTSVEQLNAAIANLSGSIRVKGVYPDYGEYITYSLKLEQ